MERLSSGDLLTLALKAGFDQLNGESGLSWLDQWKMMVFIKASLCRLSFKVAWSSLN